MSASIVSLAGNCALISVTSVYTVGLLSYTVILGGWLTSYPAPPLNNCISWMPPIASSLVTAAAAPIPVLLGLLEFSLNKICRFAGLVNPEPALSIHIFVIGAFVIVTGVPPTNLNLSPTL